MLKKTAKLFSIEDLENLDPQKPVNIVLSGGGEKGVAHIAFLKKIEQLGLKINAISAASAGTLVGGMYASGISLDDILDFFVKTPLFRYSWINLRKPGFFKSENYKVLIHELIKPKFSDLNIPMFVATTNLEENTSYYYDSGDLIQPILASCAVPAIFSPILINNQLHSDGGVMDNFPIYPFLEDDKPIIGSFLGGLATKKQSELRNIIKISSHSAELRAYSAEGYKFEQTAYTAVFPLENFSSFDMEKVSEIYDTACDFLNL